MPQVKLLLVERGYDIETEDFIYQIDNIVTDWDEISSEDLNWLQQNKHKFKTPKGYWYALLIKPELTVNNELVSLQEFVDNERKNLEKAEHKKKEATRKRKETMEKNKREKEVELLKELESKYK